MATDPFRLRVQKAIANCLAAISVAGGYQHNLQGRVFRGRVIFGDNDPLPMVSILEQPLPFDLLTTQPDNPDQVGGWPLVVQGFVDDDRDNPTDPAHVLMADVKKALAAEKLKARDGYILDMREITDLEIGPGTVRPPDDVSAKAFFWLTLTVTMAEDPTDPYA